MRILQLAALAICIAWGAVTPADAAEPIGAAAKVEDTLNGPSGKLVTGASVYFNDKLSTDATGVGQIVFNDGTKLALGPNAQVTIDKFVYKGDGTFGELAVSMTKGAFRWISGKSKPDAYKLSTGWANLAIRGTAFDVNVDPEGVLTLVLYEGAVTVCLANGECREIEGRCQYIATETKQQVHDPARLMRPKARALKDSGLFPFIDNDRLIEPFHIANASCKVRKLQRQKKAQAPRRTKSAKRAASGTQVAALAAPAKRSITRSGTSGSRRTSNPPSSPDPAPSADPTPSALPDPVDRPTSTVDGPRVDSGKKGHKGRSGNPGNDKNKGKAGESPSGGDFGGGTNGKGDKNGKGKGRGGGAGAGGGGGGHGQGNGHGHGGD